MSAHERIEHCVHGLARLVRDVHGESADGAISYSNNYVFAHRPHLLKFWHTGDKLHRRLFESDSQHI